MAYIKCRKKVEDETQQQSLSRRLEEYIEYSHAVMNFSNVSFFEELLDYIDKENKQ